jgi:Putative transposase
MWNPPHLGQTLVRHSHVHCVVPAGGLSPDHQRWIHPKYAGFFLPVKVLSRVFRGKFLEALRRAYDQHELDLAGGSEHLRACAVAHVRPTPSSRRIGWSTPSRPSAVRQPFSGISGATPIV